LNRFRNGVRPIPAGDEIKASEIIAMGFQSDARWRGGALVTIGLIAFPIIGTTLAVKGYVMLQQWHGRPIPSQMVAWLAYAATGWISVGVLWLWASRRGLVDQVFVLRRPTGIDWILAIVCAAVGILIIFPLSQWLAQVLLGATISGMKFRLDSVFVILVVLFWAVISAPIVEEVLFRGLAIAYLQSRGWPVWAVGTVPCVAFAAYHLPYFGAAGAMYVLFWSGMVAAIRLWRGNLTACLIIHILNNLTAYIIGPLLRG
jgi:membrane protease YdiL (CAAX protease family)